AEQPLDLLLRALGEVLVADEWRVADDGVEPPAGERVVCPVEEVGVDDAGPAGGARLRGLVGVELDADDLAARAGAPQRAHEFTVAAARLEDRAWPRLGDPCREHVGDRRRRVIAAAQLLRALVGDEVQRSRRYQNSDSCPPFGGRRKRDAISRSSSRS